jgi:hypothetical protein
MLRVLGGETCRLDCTCRDENSSLGEYAGRAGVGIDRMEGYDETIGEELFDLDFVAIENPAFGFFKVGVQSVDHPAVELVAHGLGDEAGGECPEYFVSGLARCDAFEGSCGDLFGKVSGRWAGDFDGADGASAFGVDDAVAVHGQLLWTVAILVSKGL